MNNYNTEIDTIENNFRQWLSMSKLTEQELLRFRTIPQFQIICGAVGEYTIIVIGRIINSYFEKIGEQFAFKTDDKEAKLDMGLLLIYIANKLDCANEKAPKFEQRPLYFSNIVKDFIKKNLS